jgi:SMI1 / KNR4 family (SUKH-1)
MTTKAYDGLTALATLRSKLDTASYLEVIHEGGYAWKAHFVFNNPAMVEAIEVVKGKLQLPLLIAYEQFLLHYDGALLYHADVYGQWGFRLYGTKDLLTTSMHKKKPYGNDWPPAYLVFAESLGDADLLVLDTAQTVNEGKDCRVIDGDSGYPPHMWKGAARSFGDWLDRLVVAQGAKYWRWY